MTTETPYEDDCFRTNLLRALVQPGLSVIMKSLVLVLILVATCYGVRGQSPSPSPSPNGLTGQEYREILANERKLLDDQSERYYSRVDNLLNRSIYVLGVLGVVALGLFYFAFGRTPKDLKGLVHEHFEKKAGAFIESEIDDLRSVVKNLKTQVTELQAFQQQQVTWVFSTDKINAEPELEALHANGLQNIAIAAPEKVDELKLGDPDLVILSYDGTAEGQARLRYIVEALKQKRPPVSLLIYTYNPEGEEVRLGDAERAVLKDFRWYLPVNFPTTLLAQTQLLVRKRTNDTK